MSQAVVSKRSLTDSAVWPIPKGRGSSTGMVVLEAKKLDGGLVEVTLDGTGLPVEWRQGDIYEGSDGRRWKFYSSRRGTARPCILLEGEGLPKINKPLIPVNEDGGDAIWLTGAQARTVLHILRTVQIWRKNENCYRRSPGLDKLAMHSEHLDTASTSALFERLRAVGYGS